MSGRKPSRWSKKRAAKSALLPKRLIATRFTSLMLLMPLRPKMRLSMVLPRRPNITNSSAGVEITTCGENMPTCASSEDSAAAAAGAAWAKIKIAARRNMKRFIPILISFDEGGGVRLTRIPASPYTAEQMSNQVCGGAAMRSFFMFLVVILLHGVASAQTPARVMSGYAAVSGPHAVLWMAREAGLFEKNGLRTEIAYIRSGSTMGQTLVSGEIQMSP